MGLRSRTSIRLQDHDYRTGAYFVTLCSTGRECLFGMIRGGTVELSAAGMLVEEEWKKTGLIRKEVRLDGWVVMPNHLHAIVFMPDSDRAPSAQGAGGAYGRTPLRRAGRSLGSLISGFKASSASRINRFRGTPGVSIWQRGYHDRVIRSERHLNRLRRYILENPLHWADDQMYR